MAHNRACLLYVVVRYRQAENSAIAFKNERLKGIEDEAWANKAKQALQEGFLTDEENQAWFNRMQERLNATT